MKFHDICSVQIGQFMFSHKHDLLLKTFDNLFILNSQSTAKKQEPLNLFKLLYVEQIFFSFL